MFARNKVRPRARGITYREPGYVCDQACRAERIVEQARVAAMSRSGWRIPA